MATTVVEAVIALAATPVATSTRRQEREGYVPLFLADLVGYLEYAIPGLSPTREYF